jgi:hypothetical protein
MNGSIEYRWIKLAGQGWCFWLRVTRETDMRLVAVAVNRQGDSIAPVGFDERVHVIEKAAATIRPARMNLTYAELEVAPSSATTSWSCAGWPPVPRSAGC